MATLGKVFYLVYSYGSIFDAVLLKMSEHRWKNTIRLKEIYMTEHGIRTENLVGTKNYLDFTFYESFGTTLWEIYTSIIFPLLYYFILKDLVGVLKLFKDMLCLPSVLEILQN